MDKTAVRKLVYSMVKFLRGQLQEGSDLSEEGLESVEVALQCLELAYNVGEANSELSVNKSLYDIFVEGVGEQEAKKSPEFSAPPPSSPEDQAEAEVLKNEGNTFMRDEKYSEALDRYTKAIGKDGANAVYYCNRAAAHSKLNNHFDAIEDCKRALLIESNYSKAYGRMGLAYSSLNNHVKAKECYEMAIALDPDNQSYKNNLSFAEEKIAEAPPPLNLPFPGGLGNLAGLGGEGAPDLAGLLNNPALMNMATTLMSDPNMQNMMSQFIGGAVNRGSTESSTTDTQQSAPPPSNTAPGMPNFAGLNANPGSMESLLTAGRQLAEQIQSRHPDLVNQLRNQMDRPEGNGQSDGNPPTGS